MMTLRARCHDGEQFKFPGKPGRKASHPGVVAKGSTRACLEEVHGEKERGLGLRLGWGGVGPQEIPVQEGRDEGRGGQLNSFFLVTLACWLL